MTAALLVLAGLCAAASSFALVDRASAIARIDPASARRWIGRALGRRRDREARAALPGLIETIATGLASGLSLELAFAEAAAAQPAPLDRATRRAAAALSLGARPEHALVAYEADVPAADLAPLAVTLGAFARTGGRAGRSLARVAALLRGRLALEDERAALTAQGRASALVLVLLAPLGALFFAVATEDYLATLVGPGRPLLALAIGLELAGALWLARLVHVGRGKNDLASLVDALVIGLDAGLTFEQALGALVARSPDLARMAEARRLLADLSLGRGPREAFGRFAAAGQAEARVAALVETAGRFGAPLADLLVAQADALREHERRRTETAARRLPVLMLFPLTFCVLPALLIVFLGPPLLSFVR